MTKSTTRRTIIAFAAAVPALALGAGAQAGVPQANAKYQTKPNANGQQCNKCNYFIAGAKPTDNGTCKVVAGSISPNGWCQLFAAKH